MSTFIYQIIAYMHCRPQHKMESPRQGVLSTEAGEVRLLPEFAGDCLRFLEGCDRLWLIYDFHCNDSWSPVVKAPRGGEVRPGVWASRSPYRPNSIGISCVQLERVEGASLWVREHDLLDQTPIVDIKPYLAYADSFPEAKVAWLNDVKPVKVKFTEQALREVSWLSQQLQLDLKALITNQLEYEPLNKKKKRLIMSPNGYQLAYRTWRFHFSFSEIEGVTVSTVSSGYSLFELSDASDLYQDKSVHRNFVKTFKN